MKSRIGIIAAVLVVMAVGLGVWLWLSAGHESTDDAQVDAPSRRSRRVGHGGGVRSATISSWIRHRLAELDRATMSPSTGRAELADAEASRSRPEHRADRVDDGHQRR